MDGELSALEREYNTLKKKRDALRDQLWPQPRRGSNVMPSGPGIVKQIRGEMQLDSLDSQMNVLRNRIRDLIEVEGG